ncbi:MAG: patatin-like phospholipase family protein [Rhizobiaceae bacterium]
MSIRKTYQDTDLTNNEVEKALLDDKRVINLIAEIELRITNNEFGQHLDEYFWLCAIRNKNQKTIKFATARTAQKSRLNNNQEVFRIANIAMQGGGLLGLAHAGFVIGLEKAGIRFAGLAGTSAGSIAAMGILAARKDDPMKASGESLVKMIDEMPMANFIDGNRPNRILIKRALKGRSLLTMEGILGGVSAVKSLIHRRGLNSGNSFLEYFDLLLKEHGLAKMSDVEKRLNAANKLFRHAKNDLLNEIKNRDNAKDYLNQFEQKDIFKKAKLDDQQPATGQHFLNIIATAMPIGIAIRFPRDLKYFNHEYQGLSPALMVRASMSIPLFFEPIRFRIRKNSWSKSRNHSTNPSKLSDKYFLNSKIEQLVHPDTFDEFSWLDEVYFLDGGLFSNLPTDSFNDFAPDIPTISVPLLPKPKKSPAVGRRSIKGFFRDATQVASAVRLNRDREFYFLRKNKRDVFESNQKLLKRYSKKGIHVPRSFPFRLAEIDTGDANWLDFNMAHEAKVALLVAGLTRAKEFLFKDIQGDYSNDD